MTLTLQEIRAIEEYDGPVTRVPPGVSGVPLPYWDGKMLRSGETYEEMRSRMAASMTKAARAAMQRSKSAARDRDEEMRASLPGEFMAADVAKAEGISIEAARVYIRSRVELGAIRYVRDVPHPEGHLARLKVYAWEARP